MKCLHFLAPEEFAFEQMLMNMGEFLMQSEVTDKQQVDSIERLLLRIKAAASQK